MSPTSQPSTSALQEAEEDLIQAFKGFTLPLTQPEKVVKTPLNGFVTPKKGPKIEDEIMGPKAYDLLLKAGYDPAKDKAMGQLPLEVTNNKIHGLNDTQNMMRQKGWAVKNSTRGLGYKPKPPLCLLINRPNNEAETKQKTPTHPTWAVMCKYPTKLEVVLIGRTRPEEPYFRKRPLKLAQKSYWRKILPPTEQKK
ncbi:hypothetical protein LIER_15994 [Lithospermum erythrorhizon]|uniref:G-patch domain-containing protein n=1 Tax=Lithospermum erythrorhizon TaxID=34254 RepID=A0AAV3Q5C8_LITER